MGLDAYEVDVEGELVFPPGQVAAWRELNVDGDLFADWPEAFRWTRSEDPLVSVGTWVDDCVRYEIGRGRLFLKFYFDEVGGEVGGRGGSGESRARVQGRLAAEDYEARKRSIATLFRLAGFVGAQGWLEFVGGSDVTIGYRVEVHPGASVMAPLPQGDLTRALGQR